MIRILLTLQHRLNPLHVYSRFMDRGLGKRLSFVLCKYYEILIFAWMSYLIKVLIHFCFTLNKTSALSEELRKK